MNNSRSKFLTVMLVLGFLFLYLPIFVMMGYSFNENRLVVVWTGFSFKWYESLFSDRQLMNAGWNSLKLALASSTIATAMGTLCAIVLVRYGAFRGKALFTFMVTAPMVMPEVVTGLSALLLFVAMDNAIGWPSGRGFTTMLIAHITFLTAYITVVVQSRLAVMDRSLEEAAMDLGATPFKTFMLITLPIIAPALVSGWLLGFTISLDDVVISAFTTGPGSSTLPIEIFGMARRGISPKINALATIIVLIVAVGIIIASIIMNRAEKRRQQEMQQAFDKSE